MNEKNSLLFIKNTNVRGKAIQGRALCEHGVQQPGKECLIRVLARDFWQELSPGVTVTGTRMTAGLKYHQFMSCELHLEEQRLSKWKFLNSPAHLTLVPSWTMKKPSRWRLTKWRHFTCSATMAYVCLQELCFTSEHLGLYFNPLSKNLDDNSSTAEQNALLCELTLYD